MVFPRVGQVWETLRDCDVTFRPWFPTMQNEIGSTGKVRPVPLPLQWRLGLRARLQKGEGIRIIRFDDNNKPLRITFQPLRYAELQAQIVPEDIRQVPGYAGYELSVKTAKTMADFGKDAPQTYFNEAFRLVRDLT